MRFKNSYASLLAIFLVFACEKTDPVNVENTDIPLLSQLIIDSEIYKEFTYNSANLVTEEKSSACFMQHQYNSKNQLVLTNYYEDLRMYSSLYSTLDSARNREEWVSPENTERTAYKSFEYNENGQLSKITNNRLHTGCEFYSLFSYDDQNRIEKQTFYSGGTSDGFIKYEYDDIGNLIIQEHYITDNEDVTSLSNSTVYSFDNMKNPYKSFNKLLMPGLHTNTNNIIKEVYTLYSYVDGSIDDVIVWEDSYEYNGEGYPVRQNEAIEYIYR